jgi:flavodoxin
MNALVVSESCFGNTTRIADAIGAGLRSRGVTLTVVDAAAVPALDGVDLLIVGAPTHSMGLPGPGTRRQAQNKGGRVPANGVAEWLATLPTSTGLRAAVFDTVTGTGFFNGSAAKKIEKQLRNRSFDVVARQSFLASAVDGPLAEGETTRAEQWATSLL